MVKRNDDRVVVADKIDLEEFFYRGIVNSLKELYRLPPEGLEELVGDYFLLNVLLKRKPDETIVRYFAFVLSSNTQIDDFEVTISSALHVCSCYDPVLNPKPFVMAGDLITLLLGYLGKESQEVRRLGIEPIRRGELITGFFDSARWYYEQASRAFGARAKPDFKKEELFGTIAEDYPFYFAAIRLLGRNQIRAAA